MGIPQAWTSGLREGDLLLRINAERVGNLGTLGYVIAESRIVYSLRIQRGDEILALSRC